MPPTWRLLIAIGLATLVARPSRAEMRQWSDATGKFTIDAEFVALDAGVVKLKNAQGKVLTIPLARLSRDDRRVIQELAAPPVFADDAGSPLASMVRVIVPLAGAEGEAEEITLVGFAVQTAEPAPVIVIARSTLPKDVEESELTSGLSQPLLLALRTDDEFGAATNAAGAGMAGMSDGRAVALDDGRGAPPVDDGRSRGRPAIDDTPVAPAPAAAAAPVDPNAADKFIVLRAAAEARIPMLALAMDPPAEGDVVSVARLPRPQVRTPAARRPPIPWTPWKVLAGPQLQTEFSLAPQDGAFPYFATLPVLNAKKEVVGVLNPGAKALPDKTRVATAIGIGTLRAALEQAGIQVTAPTPPPPDPAALALGGRLPLGPPAGDQELSIAAVYFLNATEWLKQYGTLPPGAVPVDPRTGAVDPRAAPVDPHAAPTDPHADPRAVPVVDPHADPAADPRAVPTDPHADPAGAAR